MASAAVYMFSASALRVGANLEAALAKKAWLSPEGELRSCSHFFVPKRLSNLVAENFKALQPICLFDSLKKILSENFHQVWAHIFIGATGIAVRAIAPFLRHKSLDPPVIVIDPQGRFVISLLSGHWAGGNDLCRFLASLLNAQAVITTASDTQPEDLALDLLIRKASLKILDWEKLPSFQGRILGGEKLYIYDPGNFLEARSWLKPIAYPENTDSNLLIAVDWHKRPPAPTLLRLVPAFFCLGFGFRKGVCAIELFRAFQKFCTALNLAEEAVSVCATVQEKAIEAAAKDFAAMANLKLESFSAAKLAKVSSPNPSKACGRRFSLPPFSVCESAALLSAMALGESSTGGARLFAEKTAFNAKITMALACPESCLHHLASSV